MSFQRGDDVELADELLAKLGQSDHLVYAEGALHRYDPTTGVWGALEGAYLSRVVQGLAGTVVGGAKPHALRISAGAVSGAIRLACDRMAAPDFFDDATRGLAFKNGLVRASETGVLLEAHAPEHRARFAYPFDYRPAPRPERLLAFFDEVFGGDADAAAKVACIQQFAGMTLCGRATDLQRALVFVGGGADAKSTAASIIEKAMPPGSSCAVVPQRWRSELHAAHLAGKLLNLVLELPTEALGDAEVVKLVIAGDPIGARRIRRDAFTFRPIAGHLFATNALPKVGEVTHGFWRRWIVLRFGRRFGSSEQNPQIVHEIVSSELPEIVSWCVAGARTALTQRGYTIPESSEVELATWRGQSMPVEAFIELCTAGADRTKWTPARDVYNAYRAFAGRHGLPLVSENRFGRAMTRLGFGSVSDGSRRLYPVVLEGRH